MSSLTYITDFHQNSLFPIIADYGITHTCESSGGSIFSPSRQLSKSSARGKNQVPKNLDLHFAINISGNSPFGTYALTKNAERYEW
jgi:hypothetical protein